ncbi:MAG: O-succinylhomoserine sulfhydrylase [Candidatus Puniceispirillaceae bacterium]
MADKTYGPNTQLIKSGIARSQFDETAEALYLTSGYVYKTAEQAEAAFNGTQDRYVYSRYGNPTVSALQDKMAALEGAERCLATGTGMAAIFAAMACQLDQGDKVVASRALFGACHAILTEILPKWGIEVTLLDGRDITAWQAALQTPCKLVFLETPSNPTLQLVDLAKVCDLAHKAGARVVVDNVFATPVHQKPLSLGADIVCYSATKHIDGQGRVMGGLILGDAAFIDDELMPFYRQTGATMSPFNAWVLLKSLETLPLRVEAQSQSAMKIASFLADHEKIETVSYPGHKSHPQYALAQSQMTGPGSLMAFEVKGGKTAAFAMLNALSLIDISNNLGDSKTLACHPASTTHMNIGADERAILGINDGHIRLSVGLEDCEDLIADLRDSLAQLP